MLPEVRGEGLQVGEDRAVGADVDVARQGVAVDGAGRQVRDEGGGGLGEAVPALAQVVGVGRVDRVARQAQPALDAAEEFPAGQAERRRLQGVDLAEQRREVGGGGRADRLGETAPQGDGVAVDQQRFGLDGADGRDALLLEPDGDPQFAAGAFQEFGARPTLATTSPKAKTAFSPKASRVASSAGVERPAAASTDLAWGSSIVPP